MTVGYSGPGAGELGDSGGVRSAAVLGRAVPGRVWELSTLNVVGIVYVICATRLPNAYFVGALLDTGACGRALWVTVQF